MVAASPARFAAAPVHEPIASATRGALRDANAASPSRQRRTGRGEEEQAHARASERAVDLGGRGEDRPVVGLPADRLAEPAASSGRGRASRGAGGGS